MRCVLKQNVVWPESLHTADNVATILLHGDDGQLVPIPAPLLVAVSPLVRSILAEHPSPAFVKCCISLPSVPEDLLKVFRNIISTGEAADACENREEEVRQVLEMLGVKASLVSCHSGCITVGKVFDGKVGNVDAEILKVETTPTEMEYWENADDASVFNTSDGTAGNVPALEIKIDVDVTDMLKDPELRVKCSRSGCKQELGRDQVKDHEVRCACRVVPCPDCHEKIVFKDMDEHIRVEHKYEESHGEENYIEPLLKVERISVDRDWVLFSHKYSGAQFYPQFVKRKGLWYFWVMMQEDPVGAAGWGFHAKAASEENQIAVEYSGKVHSIDLTEREILETGQYLLLNKQRVEKLKVPLPPEVARRTGNTSQLTISFRIIKL